MPEGAAEGQPQQQNPDQQRDPRTPQVIDELSNAARILKDPRLLSMSERSEKPPSLISYHSTDKVNEVILSRDDFQRLDYAVPKLPAPLRNHERIIPITANFFESDEGTNDRVGHFNNVWMTLDKNNPTAYQLLGEDGQPVSLNDTISVKEKVVERPDLLPHILDAVSGEKGIPYKPL